MRIRLTLKARFILVAGGAVAAVALAITAVAFLAIRTDLQNQVRQEVAARADSVAAARRCQYHGHIPNGWVPPHSSGGFANLTYTQVVTSDGQVWAPPGDLRLLAPSAAAIAVAAGKQDSFYSSARINNIRAMVYTEQIAPGLAIQVAEATTSTDQEVSSIGTMLAVLSVVGVLSATLLGWAVARAGLAPVARLAGVAEEVTLTGDPGRRVEVRRRDELGRLAMSFNAMLGALQRSLDAQRRLVSDASHELRTPARQPPHQRRPAARAPGDARRRAQRDPRPGRRPGRGAQPPGRQRHRPGPGRAPAAGAVADPVRRGGVRRPRRRPARLAEDRVRRRPGPLHGQRAAPTGCGWRSRTCSTTRPSSARPRGRSRSGWPTASSPCATTAPASTPTTCRSSSTASTGPRRPGPPPGRASASRSSARSRWATAGSVTADPAPGGGTVMRFSLPGLASPDRGIGRGPAPGDPAGPDVHGGEPGPAAGLGASAGCRAGSPGRARSLRAARSAG